MQRGSGQFREGETIMDFDDDNGDSEDEYEDD